MVCKLLFSIIYFFVSSNFNFLYLIINYTVTVGDEYDNEVINLPLQQPDWQLDNNVYGK